MLLAASFFSAKNIRFLQHHLSIEVASPHRLFLLSSLPHVRGGHHLLKNETADLLCKVLAAGHLACEGCLSSSTS
jgi:hypothetical protein